MILFRNLWISFVRVACGWSLVMSLVADYGSSEDESVASGDEEGGGHNTPRSMACHAH